MSKRLILAVTGAVLLAASVTTFMCVDKSNDPMDDLFRANVEALTRNESEIYTCETRIKEGDRKTFFCGSCSWVENSEPTWTSFTSSCTK